MTRIWIIKPNTPEDWIFDGVELIAGKRSLGSLVSRIKSSKWVQQIDINSQDDGSDFLNQLSIGLNCSTESYVNTVQIYPHPSYTIECSYRSDLNFQNSQEFNYFSTVTNIESINIFGSGIFFKTANKCLIDLDFEELVSQIVNFYYLKTYKLRSDGNFEELGMNNFEPEITRRLDGYKVKKFGDWLVFSDDPKSNLSELKPSGNLITKFKNLIWLKVKTHIGDIHEAIESIGYEKNKDGDLRGLYMDLNPEYIISVFF